jgi:hypothetical protein
MVGACPPTPQEKCKACRLGHPCPVHDCEKTPDYDSLAKKKRKKFSGSKKGKKRQKKKTSDTKK